jgi:hypothetical protein
VEKTMALAKKQIDKAQLEQICALYLRPKGHRVERVTISRSPNPARNWFVAEIEPPLSLVNELDARAALGELQREFLLQE